MDSGHFVLYRKYPEEHDILICKTVALIKVKTRPESCPKYTPKVTYDVAVNIVHCAVHLYNVYNP